VHVSIGEWLVLAATVVLGGTVQTTVGFGGNLLAVPVVALVIPTALPGALVFPGIPVSIAMALHERRHIDRVGVRFLTLGRIPGTIAGAAIVALVSGELLALVAGTAVIVAVIISIAAARLHPGVTPRSALTVGAAAGTLGTAAAIDGPPLALLYQHHSQEEFRATLALQFTIGTVFTLVGLLVADRLEAWQVLLGLSLMPAFGLGLAAGLRVRRHTKAYNLRPVVLSFAALAGVAAVVRGIG
jgi:uncharacterized protein